MPAARITGPEIAARRTFGPRLLRARPAAPQRVARPMPGARECLRAVRAGRQPPSEHADVAPGRKARAAQVRVDFGLRDPWRAHQLWRCMPRT